MLQQNLVGEVLQGHYQVISQLGDNGVLVLSVNANSTASRSGVKAGDVILSINENSVSNVKQVQNAIQFSGLDSVLNFNVDRNGENVSLKVSVGCCYNPQQSKKP